MPRYALALALCVAGATALGAAECQTPECEEFEGDNGLCPEHIGPPCPRNYVNNMTDYTEGASLKIEADLREFMNQSLYTYLGLMVDAFPPSSFDTADVFNGVAGRALVALRLYERFGNASHLDLASSYRTERNRATTASPRPVSQVHRSGRCQGRQNLKQIRRPQLGTRRHVVHRRRNSRP